MTTNPTELVYKNYRDTGIDFTIEKLGQCDKDVSDKVIVELTILIPSDDGKAILPMYRYGQRLAILGESLLPRWGVAGDNVRFRTDKFVHNTYSEAFAKATEAATWQLDKFVQAEFDRKIALINAEKE
ncbi:MAG: hypothetical protein LUO93_06225 [Methanomicrobiales archaeon]|nr:hypothetical protein [Methanomicrobiales archaeon]